MHSIIDKIFTKFCYQMNMVGTIQNTLDNISTDNQLIQIRTVGRYRC